MVARCKSSGGSVMPSTGHHDMWALPSPAATPPTSPNLGPTVSAKDSHLLVMKFGGSSLATLEHLRRVADIVLKHLPSRPVLVLSAMGKTTNELLAAATRALEEGEVDISKVRQVTASVFDELRLPLPVEITQLLEELERMLSGVSLLKELSAKSRDRVVSFGERLSVRTFAAVFNHVAPDCRVRAKALDSWEAGMVTSSGGGSANSAFSQCEVLPRAYTNLDAYFSPLRLKYAFLPVVTGYIAKDTEGVITTLGRDGSDLTATVVGAAIQASEVQIWKDVSGVMTTDPRVVPAARPVTTLTFEEAAELSTFGAKVVHPAAILPAWLARIPISVRNSTAPEQPGTRIVSDIGAAADGSRDSRVAALSSKRHITMVVIKSTRMLGQHGFLAHVFQVFNKFEVSVDVIATSEVTVSITLDRDYKAVDLDALRKELEQVSQVEVRENMSMLTLIANRKESTIVLREAFEAFEKLKVEVEMVSHGASNVNVTFVIPDAKLLESARELHSRFFER